MGTSTSISRLAAYYARNGFLATTRRAVLALKRGLFSSRMRLFYCDLSEQTMPPEDSPGAPKVERKESLAELSPQDLQDMTSYWNPRLALQNIQERFGQGALLWLIKSEDRLAGFGWTLQGRTIEPHYFPLGPHDVHFFDFHVFPPYRGRGMNPLLVNHMLRSLAEGGGGRAFIEAAEWNQAQLASLKKTPFRHLGWARKFTVVRQTIVCWAGDGPVVEHDRPPRGAGAPSGEGSPQPLNRRGNPPAR
ncbi:MAG TPA: GNAT family N-acetyltransferase [Terriglobia bacterium]|nr:GNAT family N-acetyltransferase [Terriglobia bacterium]